jgi:hypothetical protein
MSQTWLASPDTMLIVIVFLQPSNLKRSKLPPILFTVIGLKEQLFDFYLRSSDAVSHTIDDRLCAAAWDPVRGLRKKRLSNVKRLL